MKSYVKPMVLANEELAESVYMASGDCYTVEAFITQAPQLGRGDYRIQVNAKHDADHHSSSRTFVITFNQPVVYVNSLAASYSGDGTNQLTLTYTDGINGSYHNNEVDNIGLNDLIVTADAGLAVTGYYCSYCNLECGAH